MAQVSFRANVGKVRGFAPAQNGGKSRFSFSAAEGHRRLNRQTNEWEDTGTTWFNVTVFGRQAEDLADIITEGAKQQVVVSGRQETRAYESNGKSGESLDVIADHVGLVHRAPQGSNQQPSQSSQQGWGGNTWGGDQQAAGDWGTPAPGGSPAPF